MRELLRDFTRIGNGEELAPVFDVLTPFNLLRALMSYDPTFIGGRQHDAQECLSNLLHASRLSAEVFRAGASVQQSQVALCELPHDAMVAARSEPLDMAAFVATSLLDDRSLSRAPRVLALQLPNIYIVDDHPFFVDVPVRWPTSVLDLSACIRGPAAEAAKARYRLRAVVVHLNGRAQASLGMSSGHYVAYL